MTEVHPPVVIQQTSKPEHVPAETRQLLSETIRQRRAAQLQREAASHFGFLATSTSLTTVVSSQQRDTGMVGASRRRRKKTSVCADERGEVPQRIRRIMFHEYKGPVDDLDYPVTPTDMSSDVLKTNDVWESFSPNLHVTSCVNLSVNDTISSSFVGGIDDTLKLHPSLAPMSIATPLHLQVNAQRNGHSAGVSVDVTASHHQHPVLAEVLFPSKPASMTSSTMPPSHVTSLSRDHPTVPPSHVFQPSVSTGLMTSAVQQVKPVGGKTSKNSNRASRRQSNSNLTKSNAAAVLQSNPLAVKMDSLTVTRLRTECRLRRLPVSGRKRNLVLRLLPYAVAILNRAPSNQAPVVAAAGVLPHVETAISTSSSDTAPTLDSRAPFVSLDTLIAASNETRRDDIRTEYADVDTVNSRQSDTSTDEMCSRSSTSPADRDPGETLMCRWLRQQRIIDELRHQLVYYRRALAAASSNATGSVDAVLNGTSTDWSLDADVSKRQTTHVNLLPALREKDLWSTYETVGSVGGGGRSDGAEESPVSEAQLTDDSWTEPFDDARSCSGDDSTADVTSHAHAPPDYDEAVRYMRQQITRQDENDELLSALQCSPTAMSSSCGTGVDSDSDILCTMDDVIEVLTNWGEL